MSRRGEEPRRHKWIATVAAADEEGCWSIALAFHDRDRQVCELRAMGAGETASEIPYAAELSRVLMVFGTHFADRADQVPERGPRGGAQTRSDQEYEHQSKAA